MQFHPSYDYSDFVEGLRPKMNDDGSMGFELQDGIFKCFVDKARKNFEDSQKTKERIVREQSTNGAIAQFIDEIEYGKNEFSTITGNKIFISDIGYDRIYLYIPGNKYTSKLTIPLDEIRQLLAGPMDQKFFRYASSN